MTYKPKLSKTAILKEAVARKAVLTNAKPLTLNDNFPQQNSFILDTSRFVSAQCSRRAGKTNGLALRFFKAMEKHPRSQSLYLAHTRASAKEIIWLVLQELNELHGLGCTFLESKLEMTHPNGAKLSIYGADMKNFTKRLRGRKYPAVAIDEAQDFGSHLQSLIDDILTPSIADYADGWLAVTGTPGPVPQGYFFEVTQNGRYGYSRHGWTLLENPHMPNAAGFLSEIIEKREWDKENPTYRREYLNQWVLDANSLWVRYSEKTNHYQQLPSGHKWHYILGADIGFRDADAFAVIAWSETCPETYLVEELIMPRQGITEFIDQMRHFQNKYNVTKTVMDEGGLGKKIAEEMRRRFGISVEPADKLRKQENVDLLNDALRRGRFKAKSNSRFALDSYLVQIDWDKTTPNRIVIKKQPHSDIIDAVLYAFKESYSFTYEPEKPKLYPGTKEWAEAQEKGMWESELEKHENELQFERELRQNLYGIEE